MNGSTFDAKAPAVRSSKASASACRRFHFRAICRLRSATRTFFETNDASRTTTSSSTLRASNHASGPCTSVAIEPRPPSRAVAAGAAARRRAARLQLAREGVGAAEGGAVAQPAEELEQRLGGAHQRLPDGGRHLGSHRLLAAVGVDPLPHRPEAAVHLVGGGGRRRPFVEVAELRAAPQQHRRRVGARRQHSGAAVLTERIRPRRRHLRLPTSSVARRAGFSSAAGASAASSAAGGAGGESAAHAARSSSPARHGRSSSACARSAVPCTPRTSRAASR